MCLCGSVANNGARLAGHATRAPGIEVSSGALGHGLPMAAGMALAGKRDHASHRIFAVLSDGECDEGSTCRDRGRCYLLNL